MKQAVIDEATKQGIDPNYALSVMQVESGGDTNAVSKTGAKGAFQMFPAAVKDVGGDYNAMVKDPALQAQYGVKYLKQKLDQAGGDYAKALGYYNQGKGGFDKQLKSGELAPEVVKYINHPAFANFVKDSQLTNIANPVKGLQNAQNQASKFSSGALYRGGEEQPTAEEASTTVASPNQQIQQGNTMQSVTDQTVQDIAKEKERINEQLKRQQAQNRNDAIQTAANAAMGLIFGNHQKSQTTTTTGANIHGAASNWGSSTNAVLQRLQGGFTPGAFNNFSNTGA